MSHANSNPMSDYDFAEIPDQINFEEARDDFFNRAQVQRMDPALLTVLNGFNLDNEVIERFALSTISYSQLSALDRDDLCNLGVENMDLQDEMLADFESLEGQDENLTTVLRLLKDPQRASAVDMIQNQLVSMNTLLAATILKVGASKSMQSPGVAISNKFASPDVVLAMLQDMTAHADAMMTLIRKLKNESIEQKKKDPNRKLKEMAWNSLLIVSGIVISFCIFKQMRGARKF